MRRYRLADTSHRQSRETVRSRLAFPGHHSFVIGDYPETIPEVHALLIKGRNRHWAEIIDDLMRQQSGTFFVAVGVGHLVGPDRLQGMLTERG